LWFRAQSWKFFRRNRLLAAEIGAIVAAVVAIVAIVVVAVDPVAVVVAVVWECLRAGDFVVA
jgi:hypothetical protein